MNRRQYLDAAGTAFTTSALAGCVGSGDRGEGGVFVETAVNGFALDVEFTEDSSIQEVTLIRNGELVNRATLQAGEYRTSIELVQHSNNDIRGMYPPGDHTLVATDDAGEEQEHELTIEPALEIVNVRVPEGDITGLLVEIENTGNGSGAFTPLGVLGEALHEVFPFEDHDARVNFLEYPADESDWHATRGAICSASIPRSMPISNARSRNGSGICWFPSTTVKYSASWKTSNSRLSGSVGSLGSGRVIPAS